MFSLTCTGPGVASLEGDLSLPTAVSNSAILALDPPPPGPGAGPAGGAAAAPAAPGGPLAGVSWEGGAEVPVSPVSLPGVTPVERFALPPLAVVKAGLEVASLTKLWRAIITV